MANNEKLVSGLNKLNAEAKRHLKSWELDIELAVDDAEVSKAKGRIQGYLKALVDIGLMDQDEAKEVGRFYIVK